MQSKELVQTAEGKLIKLFQIESKTHTQHHFYDKSVLLILIA